MSRFLPKSQRARLALPDCIDLDEMFSDVRYAASLARVLDYLMQIYINHSDGSYGRVARVGVVTEQFYLPMPTLDAHRAEIDLCNAIRDHALGKINDEDIKVYLKTYLDTHTFVYDHKGPRGSRSLKLGDWRQTGPDVQLYSIDYCKPNTGYVLNAIQLRLFLSLEAKRGNNVRHQITVL